MKPDTLNRRDFMRKSAALGMTAYAAKAGGLKGIEAASQSIANQTPEEVAKNEFFWREIQLGFKLDRTLTNLNNGFTCPTPRVVLESVWRYMEIINMLPVHYQRQVQQNILTIRRRMAAEFGCDPEELALTRGASESLHNRAGLPPHADDVGSAQAA
jgi:isopenicillin-N epimerase